MILFVPVDSQSFSNSGIELKAAFISTRTGETSGRLRSHVRVVRSAEIWTKRDIRGILEPGGPIDNNQYPFNQRFVWLALERPAPAGGCLVKILTCEKLH